MRHLHRRRLLMGFPVLLHHHRRRPNIQPSLN
jgi:hypothetical protein